LIEKNKNQLAESIDLQIKNSINLKKSVNDIWYRLRSPMLVSEEYKVWLQMKPIAFSVSRLEQEGENITGYIKAKTSPKVSVGERPIEFKLDSIPKFQWLSTDTTGYLIPMKMTIPDQEIADIANGYLEKEVFDLGKKKVGIENVTIQRIADRWLVEMDLNGDVQGSVRMKGKPYWNINKQEVDLKEFDYEVDSRNFLLKSSALLFKQKVEKRLLNQINDLVEVRKQEILKSIDEQLLKTNKNQWLDVSNAIDRFAIYDLGLDERGMWAYVVISGALGANFKYQTLDK